VLHKTPRAFAAKALQLLGVYKMNIALEMESNPLNLRHTLKIYGLRYSYWLLRYNGSTRYQAIRSIFFARGL
jgi:hypothetical protein